MPIIHTCIGTADEFGNAVALPGAAGPVKDRYSWPGGAQRSAEALGHVVLMGVRLYSTVTGRFLSVDPVDRGSASAYDYCGADPVNCTGLAGTWSFKLIMKVVAEVASVAAIIPGPIGMAAAGVSAVAYAVTGYWANAALMTAGIALAAVGAGAAVVAIKAAKTSIKVGTMVAKAAPKAERAFNAAKTVASKTKPALNTAKSVLKAKNEGNLVRWGMQKNGGPFRVSLGPAHNHWNKLGPVRRTLGSFHFHMEKNVGVVTNNWRGLSSRVCIWGKC